MRVRQPNRRQRRAGRPCLDAAIEASVAAVLDLGRITIEQWPEGKPLTRDDLARIERMTLGFATAKLVEMFDASSMSDTERALFMAPIGNRLADEIKARFHTVAPVAMLETEGHA